MKRTSSTIESLPIEILEQIFLRSLNFNLPRASPYLASKLSREGMYRTLILMAFWEDNAPLVPPDEEEDRGFLRQFGTYEYSPLEESDQEELQLAVLNSGWCTIHRLRKYLRELDNVFLERYWFGKGPLGAGAAADQSSRDYIKAALMDPLAYTVKDVSTRHGHGEMELLISANFIRVYKGYRVVQDFMRAPAIRRIPDKFICPNEWTESKMKMLEFLIGCVTQRRSGFPISHPLPRLHVAQDALDRGIDDAIMDRNHRVLRDLVEVHELAWWGDTEPHRYAPGDVTHHNISLEHFKTATLGVNDFTAFKILARSSAESCPILEMWFHHWVSEVGFQGWELQRLLYLIREDSEGDMVPPTMFIHGKLTEMWYDQSSTYERLFGRRPQWWKNEILPTMFSWLSLVDERE